MPLLAMVLTSLIASLLARVLLGAGLTFFTYNWVNDVLNDLIAQAQTSINQLPAFALSILNLWGIDVCIAMMLSTVQILIFVKVARVFVGKIA